MTNSKQLFTHISASGTLELSLKEVEVATPKSHEVIVRIEAAPINPSDMWPMFGPANLAEAVLSADKLTLSAPVHSSILPRIKSRLDQVLPIGNEGAGTVVAAGDSEAAQSLMGKTVAVLTGGAYAQYCCVPAQACIVHHEGTTAKHAASSFVNPLTALGMVETMRMEGHSALVHTAAASSLGQMLNKICLAQDIPLVNIVRSQQQAEILKAIGAQYICDSSSKTFKADLYKAIDKTGATLAFDAIGGGEIVSDILNAMEQSGSKDAVGFNTYGSETNKQVYIYGGLDFTPSILNRAYGMTWGIGGWLLMSFLGKLQPQQIAKLQKQVADEIKTTFACAFTEELSFEQAMTPAIVLQYNAKKTGEKYLINPNKNS
ncbi:MULTISPECIES: zinc-binding dehydrogenase [unclassified Colwellia]|jgi:NADPH:quinone reductase-like Zn-dependent oxidoreductase|uniref:zinc-binding dehydrogenase n=1 Tax=unclassified Colwellia TaxID=196834 RepID=UPI0015F3B6A1|nr:MULTISPECIES: zinc-binding dehydrogenase [unclassified Colwellia]MBA6252292.1 zinc-binding dehydrogenase [Colwellia sp. MB3u-55]MBA6398489.1 zinc-binding dehydrogenase [Colwellia sp. BRX10-4]